MKKTGLIIILSLSLVLLTAAPALAAPDKDESIYAALDYDGSVRTLQAVNRFTNIPEDQPLTDFGVLGDVQNLTTQDQPTIQDDRVVWDLGSNPPEEFYYQAILDKALPYTVALHYMLDGSTVSGDTLAGKTGQITIGMDIRPNPACDEQLRENIMVQASLSLDSEKCRQIQADGATLVVMGGYINLSYTILPGEEASYTLSIDAEDFTMEGITFNLIPYENILGDFREDVEGLTDGFDTMADSMGEMVDGTQELKDGLADMVDGLHDMDTGLRDLQEGAASFATGMGDFDGGLGGLHRGLSQLSSGSGQIKSGLHDIDSNGPFLLQGYTDVYQQLAARGDPSLTGILAQLDAFNTEFSNYLSGISTLSSQYDAFHSGIAGLPRQIQAMQDGFDELQNGFTDIQSGINDLTDGMHTMYTETAGLPTDVQELIDGQIEFQDGIIEGKEEAEDSINGFFPKDTASSVSFVDERNTVRSIQYMLKTPDIEKPKDPAPDLEGNGEHMGFFQRLIALFQ